MPIEILNLTSLPSTPFQIRQWTGSSTFTNAYYVTRGVALSTFSYDTGTFIKIKKVEDTAFDFKQDYKFYIEFTVLPNLQISGAEIKCGRVGSQDPNAVKDLYPSDWPSYPNLVHLEPKDVYENGRIKILKNGKRQGKAYALIGYRDDDREPNGQAYGNQNAQSSSNPMGPQNTGIGGFGIVQCLNSDIMMISVAVNGAPCVVGMPYFNATEHYQFVSAP
jgi:hypothetical protein